MQKLLTFIGVFLLCLAIGSACLYGVLSIGGFTMDELITVLENELSEQELFYLKLGIGINHFISFIVAGFILVYIFSIGRMKHYLGLHRKLNVGLLFQFLALMLLSLPILALIIQVIHLLPLPSWAITADSTNVALLQQILKMNHWSDLLINFTIVALFAGIGEELLFRGILQQELTPKLGPRTAILVSAVIFGAFHFEVTGLLPKIILGSIMGYAFYYTGNILAPILLHIFNNGAQVVGLYFSNTNPETLVAVSKEPIGLLHIVIALISSGMSLMLIKHIHQTYIPAYGQSV